MINAPDAFPNYPDFKDWKGNYSAGLHCSFPDCQRPLRNNNLTGLCQTHRGRRLSIRSRAAFQSAVITDSQSAPPPKMQPLRSPPVNVVRIPRAQVEAAIARAKQRRNEVDSFIENWARISP